MREKKKKGSTNTT